MVNSGVSFTHAFKEGQMKNVANDVLDFTRFAVSTLQLYNHIRKWKTGWRLICKLTEEGKLEWSDSGTCFVLDDDEQLRKYLQCNPKHADFLNMPIINYAQMKAIFTPRFVNRQQLYEPQLMIKALNFIADNKDECAQYRGLQPWERRACLKTWLCNQFA